MRGTSNKTYDFEPHGGGSGNIEAHASFPLGTTSPGICLIVPPNAKVYKKGGWMQISTGAIVALFRFASPTL